jgi:transposase-like protein
MDVIRRRHHSPDEISAKLERAAQLARAGKLQSEIAQSLGISVMTLHRWRKPGQSTQTRPPIDLGYSAAEGARLAELQLENSRLRRLVADLLLEKVRLEEEFAPKLTQKLNPNGHRS